MNGWLDLRPGYLGLRPGWMALRGDKQTNGPVDKWIDGKSSYSIGLCPLSGLLPPKKKKKKKKKKNK